MNYFLDTSILLMAAGPDHPAKAPCADFLAAARSRGSALHLSVEGAQEYAFHRLRRVGRELAVSEGRTLSRSLILHPFDAAVYLRSLDLIATTQIRGRDAVHAATAFANGFDEIVSLDHDFDLVPGLRRLDPTA